VISSYMLMIYDPQGTAGKTHEGAQEGQLACSTGWDSKMQHESAVT